MQSQLCEKCLSIPPYFWAQDFDDEGFPRVPQVNLQPYRSMEAAAAAGCPLCRILIQSAQTDFLDEMTLKKVTVTLSRAMLDSHQGVCLAVGADDISHTTFFRVPELWSDGPPMGVEDHVDNFKIMRTWIQNCKQNHDACNRELQSFLPSRLLDLQAFQTGQDIKLVSLQEADFSDRGFQQQYITLSHCWGPAEKRPITTTKGSLKDRMTRISIHDLSKTFRDAVRIARELHQRYLWIDSLCIIQDDGNDWAREAALMANVYGKSFCTLAALDSKDSTEGCKLVSDIQNIGTFLELDFGHSKNDPYSCRVRIFEDEPRAWHLEYGDNPYKHDDYGDHPLRTRAWTLQERELSRRSVHFGKHQMLWECRELKASTQLPWHHKTLEDDFEPWPIRNQLSESLDPGGPVATRDRWYELMEDYSFRRLTNETDKLPALSGLAHNFQQIFPQAKYVAGIWSTHLPAALLWRTKYSARRPLSYIAPTWSWSSVVGSITYESQRILDSGGRIEHRSQERASDCDFGNLSVRKMFIQPKQNDDYGAILSASVYLSGALLTIIDSNPQPRDFESDFQIRLSRAILTKDGVTVGLLYPDVVDEMPYMEELFCLRIRAEPYYSLIPRPSDLYKGQEVDDLVMGLVLKKEPKTGNEFRSPKEFRRLGLARWVMT